MKKNKIAIFATVALLAVGTAFGASKMHQKKFTSVWYKLTSTGSCTPASCGTDTDNPACIPGAYAYYTDNACSIVTTSIVYHL